MEVAKVNGVFDPEQECAHDGVDVKDQSQQDDHIAHGGDALQQCIYQELQFGKNGDHPEYPQNPGKSQHRNIMRVDTGNETNGDNDKSKTFQGSAKKLQGLAPFARIFKVISMAKMIIMMRSMACSNE